MRLFESAFTYVRRVRRTFGGTPQVEDLERPAAALPNPPASTGPTPPALPALLDAGPAAAPETQHADFDDLLAGLGAEPSEPSETSALERKDREIAELQRNLEMLRPLGDELARVEQLRLTERAEFEARIASLVASAKPRTPGPDLRDVARLVTALESTLAEAQSADRPVAEGESAAPAAPSALDEVRAALDRARERLTRSRRRASEWERKASAYRFEGQRLRERLRELERERSAQRAQRRRLLAPVRQLARRPGKRPRAVSRLLEVLGLEVD